MRKFITILIIAFVIVTSCNNDNEAKPKDTGIVGTWKLTESFGYDGAGTQWTSIKNGYTYTFKSDGTFTATQFATCTRGTYKFENATLTMIYVCIDPTTMGEKPGATLIENCKIENGKMYLSPTNLVCDEGCISKFSKIK